MALSDNIWTWFRGDWKQGNLPILGAADHATWQGTLVFDGARHFEGVTPDLDLHCARITRSAAAMGMNSPYTAAEIEKLIRSGIRNFRKGTELYLRPMMWSCEASAALIDPDPNSTEFAICLEELPMPTLGDMALTVSPFRRPHQDTALTEAKAACLYPNNGRIIAEARKRGFNNALSLDLDDNVAETASTNVFMLRDGEFFTPIPNGTFLNGITRQRIISLLQAARHTVREETLSVADFEGAEEIFMTGNASKVTPVTRFQERELPTDQGMMVRGLYWNYAHARG
ncbi:MAG: branched-chain amino acid aminotransferase [Rhodobacteraceae bacterium]|nr:branched-chain amino acid aminotransferase [Paracoccaceae bacterium]